MKCKLFLLFCVIVCMLSCKKGEPPIVVIDPVITLPIAVTNLNNDLILKILNDKRTAGCNCGVAVMPPVPTLTWSNALAVAASRHSTDMNKNNLLTHDSSNGNKLVDRVNATGYKFSAIGENLAYGTYTEQTVIDAWIASEEHCKNMMSANYKEVGMAKESKYWAQNFGKGL